jgi:hypothetical protein
VIDHGKLPDSQDVEARLCECGAAGSGEGHEPWCYASYVANLETENERLLEQLDATQHSEGEKT